MRYGWREADGSHNEGRRKLYKAKKRAFGDDEEAYGDDEEAYGDDEDSYGGIVEKSRKILCENANKNTRGSKQSFPANKMQRWVLKKVASRKKFIFLNKYLHNSKKSATFVFVFAGRNTFCEGNTRY